MAKNGTVTINRSAKAGRFVYSSYVKTHPSTTDTEYSPKGKV